MGYKQQAVYENPFSYHIQHSLAVDEIKARNAERQTSVAAACNTLMGNESNLDFSKPKMYDRILVDEKRKVLYCVIPKNGCTVWKALIAVVSGGMDLEQIARNTEIVHTPLLMQEMGLLYLSKYPIGEIREKLNNYYKFVIYRHPMERLASAWYNKFVQQQWYSLSYFKYVYSAFGERVGNMTLITFNRFLEALVATKPGFGKFQNDKHMRDQYKMCHPCHIKYDYIVKVETMDTDSKPLLELYGASELPVLPARNPVHDKHNAEKLLPRPNISEVLAQLPQDVWTRLKTRLETDMELLGYSWEGYI